MYVGRLNNANSPVPSATRATVAPAHRCLQSQGTPSSVTLEFKDFQGPSYDNHAHSEISYIQYTASLHAVFILQQNHYL